LKRIFEIVNDVPYNIQRQCNVMRDKRTQKNVLDTNGTVIFTTGGLTGGFALTRKLVNKRNRPLLHINFVNMPAKEAAATVAAWIESQKIEVLSVAGSRASKNHNIYQNTKTVLEQVISALNGNVASDLQNQ
jgi:hypothetical protein